MKLLNASGVLELVAKDIFEPTAKSSNTESVHRRHDELLYKIRLGNPVIKNHYHTCCVHLFRSMDGSIENSQIFPHRHWPADFEQKFWNLMYVS